jgi:hypothetical protein
MHTIYEVVDASVNHASGSSKTLRVKLTVSPEPPSKRKEWSPAGQGEDALGQYLLPCSESAGLMSTAPKTWLPHSPTTHLPFPVPLTSLPSPEQVPSYILCPLPPPSPG